MKAVIVDFNQRYLEELRASLHGLRDVHLVQADIADRDQVHAAAQEAIQVFGKINVLCNNAGIGGGGDTVDPDFDAWDQALRVNLGGTVNCTKIIAPLIISHGEGGHIVNTSSMAGLVPLPLSGLGAYQTAKFAVRGFTESLRMSMAVHGIGVSCLFPGGTRTRIIEASAPNDAARVAAREMTASWMEPEDLGARVVEGIRANAPYILTHQEFREEVRELYAMLDAAFPRHQEVPAGRAAFEDQRRAMVTARRALPIKD
jgi:NAD(P)-dependent dehydrogenase (short-subunit alcohol dehydrogenase family)